MADEVMRTLVRSTTGTGDGTIGTAGFGTDAATTVEAWPAWKLILVRAARAALQAFAAGFGIGATGIAESVLNLPPVSLMLKLKLTMVTVIGTALASIIMDTIEFLKGLDQTHPKLRG